MRYLLPLLCCLLFAAPASAQCDEMCTDGAVTIDELVGAVNLALHGCATPTHTQPPTPTNTPVLGDADKLRLLLGDWTFTYRLLSSYGADYRFDEVDESGPDPFLLGFQRTSGGTVTGKLAPPDLGRTYAVLEPGSTLCLLFAFDLFLSDVEADGIVGEVYALVDGPGGGHCNQALAGPFEMQGVRTRLLPGSGADVEPAELLSTRAQLKLLEARQGGGGASLPAGVVEAARELQRP